jgi:hypothetical protein
VLSLGSRSETGVQCSAFILQDSSGSADRKFRSAARPRKPRTERAVRATGLCAEFVRRFWFSVQRSSFSIHCSVWSQPEHHAGGADFCLPKSLRLVRKEGDVFLSAEARKGRHHLAHGASKCEKIAGHRSMRLNPKSLILSLRSGRAEPFRTAGGRAAIFSHLPTPCVGS